MKKFLTIVLSLILYALVVLIILDKTNTVDVKISMNFILNIVNRKVLVVVIYFLIFQLPYQQLPLELADNDQT